MNTYVVPAIPHHYNPYSPLQYNNTAITPTQTVNAYPQHIGQNQTHHAEFTNSVQQPQTYLTYPHQSHHQH